MTPNEMQATEAALNGWLRPVVAVLGWAIAAYAVGYFAYKLWKWLGLPNLLSLLPERPDAYVKQTDPEPTPASVRSADISPPQETEINPVPSFSHAGKQDGNALSVSPILAEATAYAEMILVDRLADLVMAGKLDKSVAIKLGMRAPTGRAYQAAKEKLETVMRSKEFPTLTKDGRPIARQLRTSAK